MAAWVAAVFEAALGAAPASVVASAPTLTPHDATYRLAARDGAAAFVGVARPASPLDELARWDVAAAATAALSATLGWTCRLTPASAVAAAGDALAFRADGPAGSVTLVASAPWSAAAPVPPPAVGEAAVLVVELPADAVDGVLLVPTGTAAAVQIWGGAVAGRVQWDDGNLAFVPTAFCAAESPASARFRVSIDGVADGAWALRAETTGLAHTRDGAASADWGSHAGEPCVWVHPTPDAALDKHAATRQSGDHETTATVEIRR